MGMLMETVVIAFVVGGILGAVTALHLSRPQRRPVEARLRRRQER